MASPRLKVIRLGLRLATAISPRLGGKLACRVFFTTESRNPKGTKARAVFAAGNTVLARAAKVPVAVPGGMVMTYAFPAPSGAGAPKVLVIHGWGSAGAYLSFMGEGLAAAGARAVVLDLPGHGLSSGRTLDVRLAAEAIATTSRHYGGFDAIVAHSFGGAAAIAAVSGLFGGIAPVATKRLGIIGAPSRLDFIFADVARALHLTEAAHQGMLAEAERRTGIHPDGFDGVALVRALSLPVMVLHAEDDKEVPAEHARRYAGLRPDVEVVWANGLGHRRIVSDPGVIAGIAGFVLEQDAAR